MPTSCACGYPPTDYSGRWPSPSEILQRTPTAYRRIRNTARFLLSNLNGFDPARDALAPEQMLDLDRWAVDRALLVQQEISEAYDTYKFWNVYQKVHNFCVQELGAFYLDIIKDRQYTTGADSLPRRSCQTDMYQIAESLVRWIAPSWPSLPRKSGNTCPASATSRSCSTPGMTV